jgi:hypothetical protein
VQQIFSLKMAMSCSGIPHGLMSHEFSIVAKMEKPSTLYTPLDFQLLYA